MRTEGRPRYRTGLKGLGLAGRAESSFGVRLSTGLLLIKQIQAGYDRDWRANKVFASIEVREGADATTIIQFTMFGGKKAQKAAGAFLDHILATPVTASTRAPTS